MGRTVKKINSDRFLAIIATFVGVVTLIIFIYQTSLMHEQSRLSVTPRLETASQFTETDSTIRFAFIIENKGIGPAIINKANIINQDKRYSVDFEDYFIEVHPQLFNYGNLIQSASIAEGSTVSPDEKLTLFTYSFPKGNMAEIQQLLNLSEEDNYPFRVVIDYASIYEDEWRIDTDKDGHPEEID